MFGRWRTRLPPLPAELRDEAQHAIPEVSSERAVRLRHEDLPPLDSGLCRNDGVAPAQPGSRNTLSLSRQTMHASGRLASRADPGIRSRRDGWVLGMASMVFACRRVRTRREFHACEGHLCRIGVSEPQPYRVGRCCSTNCRGPPRRLRVAGALRGGAQGACARTHDGGDRDERLDAARPGAGRGVQVCQSVLVPGGFKPESAARHSDS